jgi:hypothetical protein
VSWEMLVNCIVKSQDRGTALGWTWQRDGEETSRWEWGWAAYGNANRQEMAMQTRQERGRGTRLDMPTGTRLDMGTGTGSRWEWGRDADGNRDGMQTGMGMGHKGMWVIYFMLLIKINIKNIALELELRLSGQST